MGGHVLGVGLEDVNLMVGEIVLVEVRNLVACKSA
jgi:hypothetical protein